MTQEILTILDENNVEIFLRENSIRDILFVFAHPDDPEGYAAGLINNLTTINQRRSDEEKLNIKIIIATDGANGTTDLDARKELKEIRKSEQLAGAEFLGIENPSESVEFLNYVDGNLPENLDDLTQKISEQVSSSDLVITHDSRPWGRPQHLENPESAVQNHPDHRACAKAVQNAITNQDEKPILIQATWDVMEADLMSQYSIGLKKDALRLHKSQYQQNQTQMDLIEDMLNNFEDFIPRYEFFRRIDLEHIQNLQSSLLRRLGISLREGNIQQSPQPIEIQTMLQRNNVKNILFISHDDTTSENQPFYEEVKIDGKLNIVRVNSKGLDETQLLQEVVQACRENKIDLIVPDLQEEIIEAILEAIMYKSGLPYYETDGDVEPHQVKMMAFLDPNGNTKVGEYTYQFFSGMW